MSGKTPQTKSENPAYPRAHPTAPGGMSKANLRIELAETHGVSMDASREITWPSLISLVIQGRLDREAEAKADTQARAEVTAPTEADDLDEDDVFAMLDEAEQDAAEQDEDEAEVFDPETLFDEMHEAFTAEQAANPPLFLGIPGIKDYVFDGHAGAGPSASERWMHCTMSLTASRRFLETLSPNQQRTYAGANLAARTGTTAHSAGEAEINHMLGRIDDEELQAILLGLMVEPDTEAEAYDEEMGEYITEYVDLFKTYANERGEDRILVEARVGAAVPLDHLHEGEVYIIRGSADAIALPTEEDPVLVVGDLKYGDGIYVEAEANTQALIYALGVLDLLVDDEGNLITEIEKVRTHIIQPRLGGIKTWEITLDDLFDWRDDVLSPALTRALYGEAEGATYNPSPAACQFCPARGGCPALAQQRIEQAADLFDVIQEVEFTEGVDQIPDATLMDDAMLGTLLAQVNGLVTLQKEMKAEAERRLYRGHSIPGFHLVNYTPPRTWVAGAQDMIATGGIKLTKQHREAMFKEPTLVTPTQAVKTLGEEAAKIEGLIEHPEKRPVVSTGPNDRRTKWAGRPPEAMFPDHEGTEDSEDSATSAERMFPDE